MMDIIEQMLPGIGLQGDIRADCPHGKLEFSAGEEDRISLSFSNAKTFRYFLNTVRRPGLGIKSARRLLNASDKSGWEIIVRIGEKEVFRNHPGSSPSIDYRQLLPQIFLSYLGR